MTGASKFFAKQPTGDNGVCAELCGILAGAQGGDHFRAAMNEASDPARRARIEALAQRTGALASVTPAASAGFGRKA